MLASSQLTLWVRRILEQQSGNQPKSDGGSLRELRSERFAYGLWWVSHERNNGFEEGGETRAANFRVPGLES